MYNGIGLTTPRGSGTNGYVQRNWATVRKTKDSVNYRSEEEIAKLDSASIKQPNQEILDHERKRKIEVKCAEYEDSLEEQGLPKDEIAARVAAFRAKISESSGGKEAPPKDDLGRVCVRETHAIAEAQQEKNARLREAFGISPQFVEGTSLDAERRARDLAAKYPLVRTPSRERDERDQRDASSARKRKRTSPSPEHTKKSKKKKSKKNKRDKHESSKKKKKRSKSSESSSSSSDGTNSDSDSSRDNRHKNKKKKSHGRDHDSPVPSARDNTVVDIEKPSKGEWIFKAYESNKESKPSHSRDERKKRSVSSDSRKRQPVDNKDDRNRKNETQARGPVSRRERSVSEDNREHAKEHRRATYVFNMRSSRENSETHKRNKYRKPSEEPPSKYQHEKDKKQRARDASSSPEPEKKRRRSPSFCESKEGRKSKYEKERESRNNAKEKHCDSDRREHRSSSREYEKKKISYSNNTRRRSVSRDRSFVKSVSRDDNSKRNSSPEFKKTDKAEYNIQKRDKYKKGDASDDHTEKKHQHVLKSDKSKYKKRRSPSTDVSRERVSPAKKQYSQNSSQLKSKKDEYPQKHMSSDSENEFPNNKKENRKEEKTKIRKEKSQSAKSSSIEEKRDINVNSLARRISPLLRMARRESKKGANYAENSDSEFKKRKSRSPEKIARKKSRSPEKKAKRKSRSQSKSLSPQTYKKSNKNRSVTPKTTNTKKKHDKSEMARQPVTKDKPKVNSRQASRSSSSLSYSPARRSPERYRDIIEKLPEKDKRKYISSPSDLNPKKKKKKPDSKYKRKAICMDDSFSSDNDTSDYELLAMQERSNRNDLDRELDKLKSKLAQMAKAALLQKQKQELADAPSTSQAKDDAKKDEAQTEETDKPAQETREKPETRKSAERKSKNPSPIRIDSSPEAKRGRSKSRSKTTWSRASSRRSRTRSKSKSRSRSRSRSKKRSRSKSRSKLRSRSKSISKMRSRTKSRSRSKSRSKSRWSSKSRTRSKSYRRERSRSGSRRSRSSRSRSRSRSYSSRRSRGRSSHSSSYSSASSSPSSRSTRSSRSARSMAGVYADYRKSRSPSIPRRAGSPSFLDRRRITSAPSIYMSYSRNKYRSGRRY